MVDGGDKYGFYAEAISGENNYGAYGLAAGGGDTYNYGLYGRGYGNGSGAYEPATNYGVMSEAIGDDADNYGIKATASGEFTSYYATTNYGVYATATGDDATNYGVKATATGDDENYGIYATASGGTTNWAGYFDGKTKVAGSLALPIVEEDSDDYDLGDDDYTVVMEDNSYSVFLPRPDGIKGRIYVIKNKHDSGGSITLYCNYAGEYIDGTAGTTGISIAQGECRMVQSNGDDTWYILPVK